MTKKFQPNDIIYQPIEGTEDTAVYVYIGRLRRVGTIRRHALNRYAYYPDQGYRGGHYKAGEMFDTVAEVKKSLEGK